MSGTTSGRYDPFASCGSYDASNPTTTSTPNGPIHPSTVNGPIHPSTSNGPTHPRTPRKSVTPRTPGSPSDAIDPMNRSGARGTGLARCDAAHGGVPYGRPDDAAGARGAPGEPARGLYAARAAQEHPGGEPAEGRRRGITSGQGATSGQESVNDDDTDDTDDIGDIDDIAVADGAPAETAGAAAGPQDAASGAVGAPAGTQGTTTATGGGADAGDAADSHAYGSEAQAGGTGDGPGDGDGDGHGRSHPTGGFGGEDDLRRLLQSRAGALEPSPDALDQLRRAVPARRQRRRHVVLGAAAALLLGGTSIPAMVHVANLADSSERRSAGAASSRPAQGVSGGTHGEGTEQTGPRPTEPGGAAPDEGKPPGTGKAKGKNGAGPGAGAGSPAPDETMDVTSPVCGRDQLGQGTSTVGPADSTGRVYGTFRVVNTSAAACSVEGGGTVGLVAQGSTNPDHIHVVDHTSGDEATGLPDPATTPDQLVLKPGEAYEVKFAWIPQSGGGTSGCVSPGPSPTPDPSKDPGQSPDAGTPATGDSGGQAGGDEGAGGGGAPGGIVLSHTPEAGEPAAADAKVTDACAGTVYRTEALASS
ncbi:hypothetical protein [Streptomyces decoyicus]|uniref:hypothetical protein n=1 Tax=Streptomyces decoyicus TaxID=249567 RepID=UPI00382B7DA2